MSTKHVALVFLNDSEHARLLAHDLASETLEAVPAASSDQLFQLLNHRRVDVLVIENETRNFLKGIEIVERLYEDLLRPAAILLADRSLDVQRRADALGHVVVLPKKSPADTIRRSVEAMLCMATRSQVHIPLEARRLVQQCGEIPPLPQVLVKLASYLDVEKASLKELAADISVDPRMTAELLKLTNSAGLGLRQRVTNVLDAVNLLGVRRTVALVLSAAMVHAQRTLSRTLSDEIRTWYNRRCVLVASTAATFARDLSDVSEDNAYILGLFQDLGILVLSVALGDRYIQLVNRARTIGQLRLPVTEQQDLGITHAEVSAALLQKWSMPASIVSLVLKHHADERDRGLSKTDENFVRVMRIGEAFTDFYDVPKPQRFHSLNQLLGHYGPEQSVLCRSSLADAVRRAVEAGKLLSIPVPDEAKLLELAHRFAAGDVSPESRDTDDECAPVKIPAFSDAFKKVRRPQQTAIASSPDFPQILIIEDNPEVLESLVDAVRHSFPKTVGCSTPEQIAVDAHRVNVIVCDLQLGWIDGTRLIQILRMQGIHAAIIAITGERSRPVIEQAVTAGANDILLKPFEVATLVEKIEALLDGSRIAARQPVGCGV